MTVTAPVGEVSTGAALRATMRHHAAAVCVITTDVGEGPVGFCATSLCSVALQPPTVSFSVARSSTSGRAWATASYGIVHLLRSDQAPIATLFARPGADRFDHVAWQPGPYGQPLLADVVAWLLVRPERRVEVGDHVLTLCTVLSTGTDPGPTLLHRGGAFYPFPTDDR